MWIHYFWFNFISRQRWGYRMLPQWEGDYYFIISFLIVINHYFWFNFVPRQRWGHRMLPQWEGGPGGWEAPRVLAHPAAQRSLLPAEGPLLHELRQEHVGAQPRLHLRICWTGFWMPMIIWRLYDDYMMFIWWL